VIDLTLSQLVMRLCAVLFISTLQGLAMAAAAGALGDAGPRQDGRLSIDPLRHVDLLGGLVALVFSVGWAKWLTIDPRALRHGRIDLVLVVIAGVAAILLGVLALRLVRPLLLPLLPDSAAAADFALTETAIELGVSFAVLSLVPVPPLAGGQLVVAIMPKLAEKLPNVQLFLGLILAVLIAVGVVGRVLDPAVALVLSLAG
jgi:Zn-dependent protease